MNLEIVAPVAPVALRVVVAVGAVIDFHIRVGTKRVQGREVNRAQHTDADLGLVVLYLPRAPAVVVVPPLLVLFADPSLVPPVDKDRPPERREQGELPAEDGRLDTEDRVAGHDEKGRLRILPPERFKLKQRSVWWCERYEV